MVNNLNIQPSAVEEKADPIAAAFAALEKFDWGQDTGAIKTLDEAVVKAQDAKTKKALSAQFCEVLNSETSFAAKDYACRQLSLVGGDECLWVLEKLVSDKKLSHTVRYALERIGTDSAVWALGRGLKSSNKSDKLGIINSLKNIDSKETVKRLIILIDLNRESDINKDSDAELCNAACLGLQNQTNDEGDNLWFVAKEGYVKDDQAGLADALLRSAANLAAKGNVKKAKRQLRFIKKGEFSEFAKEAAQSKLKELKA